MKRSIVGSWGFLQNMIIEMDSSSSSSDEEEELLNTLICQKIKTREKDRSRIHNYFEVIVPGYTECQFQSHFRMTRASFNRLMSLIGNDLRKLQGKGREQIYSEKQASSVIWLLSTPESYRSVGSRFNMGKASLFWCFLRVINALNKVAHDIIKWPGRGEIDSIKNRFKAFAGMEGVVGAIDEKYMPIKDPHHPERYVCENDFILGDKAYPLQKWYIPPYIDRGNLTPAEQHFNKCHDKTRQVVERSFALLVGRFRRLKDMLDMSRMDMIPRTSLLVVYYTTIA